MRQVIPLVTEPSWANRKKEVKIGKHKETKYISKPNILLNKHDKILELENI